MGLSIIKTLYMKKSTLIYFSILTASVVLISYLYFFVITNQKISNNFKIIAAKSDFLESSNSLMDNLKDAETSQRGYILTGDTIYLINYKNAIYRLNLEKDRFSKLFTSYGLKKLKFSELKDLDDLMSKKQDEMNQTISEKQNHQDEAALALIKTDLGTQYMDNILNIFSQLNADQKFKEVKAKQKIQAVRVKFRIYTLISLGFTLIMYIIIGVTYYAEQRRINAKKHLSQDNPQDGKNDIFFPTETKESKPRDYFPIV